MCVHLTTSNQALINPAPTKNVSRTNFSDTDSSKVPQHVEKTRRQQGATNKRYITLLCSLADANSAAALAQWYKW